MLLIIMAEKCAVGVMKAERFAQVQIQIRQPCIIPLRSLLMFYGSRFNDNSSMTKWIRITFFHFSFPSLFWGFLVLHPGFFFASPCILPHTIPSHPSPAIALLSKVTSHASQIHTPSRTYAVSILSILILITRIALHSCCLSLPPVFLSLHTPRRSLSD
ncbi:hypothetical protein PM082_009934 [Marasmius tenuissimus]|nr:hypothetical protein PM082_009934 [Marasmius tenuissimus]